MIVCKQCGDQNEPGTQFCGSCGAYLAWKGEQTTEEPTSARAETEVGTAEAPAIEPPQARPTPAPPPPAADPPDADVAPPPVVSVEPEDDAIIEEDPSPARTVAPTSPMPADAQREDEPSEINRTEPARADIGAVAPGKEAVRRPPRRAEIEPELQPGDLICADCGAGNKPGRRYCRACGNELIEAVVVEPRVPWWRRLFGRKRRRTRRERRPRRITAGKVAAGVLILAGLSMALPQVREPAIDRAEQARVRLFPRFEPVPRSKAFASSELDAEHAATKAIDNVIQTYWAAKGTPTNGEGQLLRITFDRTVDVAQILIRTGATAKPEDFTTQPRPARVQLVFAPTGTRTTLKLADTREEQRFDVNASDVSSAEIRVGSVYRSVSGGGSSVSIAEVEFFSRE